MKVTFQTIPDPSEDPAGFQAALAANFSTLQAALAQVVDRTVVTNMLADLVFTHPHSNDEEFAQVMNGTINEAETSWIVTEDGDSLVTENDDRIVHT